MLEPLTTRKPYLFVAHPGHELCVHGWLEQTQPRVFLLTDGSGRSGRSRVESTTNVLAQTGCQRGPIYGRLTDRQLYEAILDQNVELFRNLTEEFAAALVDEEVTFVSGDAAEGFNPGHDLCRLIINAAVEIAQSRAERKITNTDFLLVDSHGAHSNSNVTIRLTYGALQRKLERARAFDGLQEEIDAALTGELEALRRYPQLSTDNTLRYKARGVKDYGVESLRTASDSRSGDRWLHEPPFYERYGELRVAGGNYGEVIRYREHILPIAEALDALVSTYLEEKPPVCVY